MDFDNLTYKDILAYYGEPLLRFKPEGEFEGFTEQQKAEELPKEVIVVPIKTKHITEVMTYARYRWGWAVNAGERFAIRHLLQLTGELENRKRGDAL